MSDTYEVIVGNVGTVYAGNDLEAARAAYADWVTQSVAMLGRAAGESVELLEDYQPIQEHRGFIAQDD